jgi:uncharacterized membrane protein SpoIIM required for sporulation
MSPVQYLIAKYAQKGYRLISESRTQAQLVRPKQFSCLLFGILFLLGVIPALLYWIFQRERSALISDTGSGVNITNEKGHTRFISYDQVERYRVPGSPTLLILFAAIVCLFLMIIIIGSLVSKTAPASSRNTIIDMNTANYVAVPEKDFTTYPYSYEGNKITFNCRVFNVLSTDQFQCYIGDESYDAVFVIAAREYSGLYDDDKITVYGIGDGEHCGKNALGGQVCSPLVRDAFFTKP